MTAHAALGGKHVVAFTGAGKRWLAEQEAATRPKRAIPPPTPIPKIFLDLAEQDAARGVVFPFPRPQEKS